MVYVADHLSAYQRKGLIARKVPFLVPRMQLFLPSLAVDLREQFHHPPAVRARMRPATQAALIYWCYHGFDHVSTPSARAPRLGYTKMSTSRVFDELETIFAGGEVLRIATIGREQRAGDALGPVQQPTQPAPYPPIDLTTPAWQLSRMGRAAAQQSAGDAAALLFCEHLVTETSR